jgi:hypothetical protein
MRRYIKPIISLIIFLVIIYSNKKNIPHTNNIDQSSIMTKKPIPISKIKAEEKRTPPERRKKSLIDQLKNINNVEYSNSKKIITKNIKEHLQVIHYVGKGADEIYQKSLEKLKKNNNTATSILIVQYENLKTKRYSKRQQIIETIRSLHADNSINFLKDIALSILPPEESLDIHHSSTQLEEGIIRLTAVEGLGYFAKAGNKEIQDTLIELARSDKTPLPIKRQAIREYLFSSKKNELGSNKQYLKQIIDPNQHFLITEKIDTPEEQMPEKFSTKAKHDDHDHSNPAPIVK